MRFTIKDAFLNPLHTPKWVKNKEGFVGLVEFVEFVGLVGFRWFPSSGLGTRLGKL